MSSPNNLNQMINLSDHYVIKKFHHGWLLGKVGSDDTLFMDRDNLIALGYIENINEVIPEAPATTPSVIIVPISKEKIQKIKNRANNDPDWRKPRI